MTADFFISRAGADAPAAAWVARILEEAGYSCVIQQRDFPIGDAFPREIENAFENCRTMIAVLSPHYTRSEYCRDEWNVAYALHRKDGGRLLPVRMATGALPPLAEAVRYLDLVGIDEDNKAAVLLKGVRVFREGGDLLDALEPDTRPLTNHAGVFLTPTFVGREKEITDIHDALWTSGSPHAPPVALTGLGGIGKSTVAKEYAFRHLHVYSGAWLVRADENTTLLADLGELGRRLNKIDQADNAQEAARNAVFEVTRLAKQLQRPFLFIFDNADTSGGEWIKRLEGQHVIITSRYATMPGAYAKNPIETLDPNAARSLLLEISSRQIDDGVDDLLSALAGLPLALVQAGSYLRENPSETFSSYLTALATRLTQGSDDWDQNQRLVAATYSPSLDRADRVASGARQLITRASVFAPDAIPLRFLAAELDNESIRGGVDAIARYSLWQSDAQGALGPTVRMHRLLQVVLLGAVAHDERYELEQLAVNAIARTLPAEPATAAAWAQMDAVMPHLLALADEARRSYWSLGSAQLFAAGASHLRRRANYASAQALSRKALEIVEGLRGKDDPLVATYLTELAASYDLPQSAEAQSLLTRALSIDEAHHGETHLAVARDLNALAGHLYRTDAPEAERLMRRALDIHRKLFGEEDPHIASYLNNIATVMSESGRREEAEQTHRRALDLAERIYSSDSFKITSYLRSLALCLEDSSNPEVELLTRRALTLDEQHYGPEHPSVAVHLGDLAKLLQNTGRALEAESHSRRALAIYETFYGLDHPRITPMLNNLAGTLVTLGRLGEAKQLALRAYKIDEGIYGSDHPETASNLINIAQLLIRQKSYGAAEALMERTLKILQDQLPASDRRISIARDSLEKLQFRRKVLFIFLGVYGALMMVFAIWYLREHFH